MKKSIVIEAPATISNIGPGFDILGCATDIPSDVVQLQIKNGNASVSIENIGAKYTVPLEPLKNTAGIAAMEFLSYVNEKINVSIKIKKLIGTGTGLGSSAASAAAVVFGLNYLLNAKLDFKDLISIAMKGEKASAGAEHADNVAPAILGGFTVIKSYAPLTVFKLKNKLELSLLILLPEIQIDTRKARRLLKKNVPLNLMIEQTGNLASLIASIVTGDRNSFEDSFKDLIIEPQRKMLIPHYEQIKLKAMEYGGRGFGISGAGPAMIVLTENNKKALEIGSNLKRYFSNKNFELRYFVTGISDKGARIVG